MRADIINLGCSKNLVDSEKLLTQLRSQGISSKIDPPSVHADVLIINTCGFILDAQEESINILLEAIEAKRKGKVRKIVAMGCLIQRYRQVLRTEMPEVDAWFGVDQLPELLACLKLDFNPEVLNQRQVSTPTHYAYLKVSEGCSRNCAFCAIPSIRGKHLSRKLEDIYEEADHLVRNGARELILIAQDLSYYGIDLYRKSMLVPLLEQLIPIPDLKWIRMHYAYPERFPDGVIDLMASEPKICKYLDIPVQHINDGMLRRMNRGYTKEDTYRVIDSLRRRIPGICLRTSLLVGFPGETEQDFHELLEFVEAVRFERLGVFSYSAEQGTYAAIHYPDDVPDEIKQERFSRIMELQRHLSEEINRSLIGQKMEIVIDRKEGHYHAGRSQFDSPEVDQEILVSSPGKPIKTGSFHQVEIIGADEYDLYGSIDLANRD